jgi:hypothetical protein
LWAPSFLPPRAKTFRIEVDVPEDVLLSVKIDERSNDLPNPRLGNLSPRQFLDDGQVDAE